MRRLISADWLKIRRYWLSRVLLGLLVLITVFQVFGKVDGLEEMEVELSSTPLAEEEMTGNLMDLFEDDVHKAAWLRQNLSYPAIIGYAARLATEFGLFFLILLTAVVCGEDFTRRTLPNLLAKGVGRGRFLIARCLTLWIAAGVGILVVALLATAGGPYLHARVTDAPISLEGLGEAVLYVLRAWLICLPFIVSILFWAVLGRHAGPAMGVGIVLHFLEYFMGIVAPSIAVIAAMGAQVPPIYRWQVRLYSLSLGYNADVFLYWGSPFMKSIDTGSTVELGSETLLSTMPWRAVAILACYSILSFGLARWILDRRDVTDET